MLKRISVILVKGKNGLILLILCSISIGLIFLSSNDAVTGPQQLGLTIISFFQSGVTNTVNWLSETINSIGEVEKLKKELARTQSELLEYKKASHDNVILREKYEYLVRELQLAQSLDYKYFSAEVIAWGSDTDFSTLVINKGQRDGIKPNMPVVGFCGGSLGLVGKTITVAYQSSIVRTILDPYCRVAVMFKDTRYKGILVGTGAASGFMEMDLVRKSALDELAAGALVVTSGLGGLFPKDIPVGRWREKYFAKDYETVVKLQIEPIIDFQKIEYVYILKTGDRD